MRPQNRSMADSPEDKNYAEIDRLEKLLQDLRGNASTARETEAIREIGLEIAVAVREVGAMLVNVGWEHFALSGPPATEEKHERFWRLGQVVTAVADAGLRVESLEEFPSLYPRSSGDRRVPGDFVLRAVRT